MQLTSTVVELTFYNHWMAKVLVRERHSAPPLHAEGSRRERGTVLSEEEEESV